MKILTLLLSLIGIQQAAGRDLIEAIACVESGPNDHAVGCDGEISRYQIKLDLWFCYTDRTDFTNHTVARKVALKHLAWLRKRYAMATQFMPSDRDLAIMWQSGFSGYKNRGFDPARMGAESNDRAQRILNLLK